MQHTSRATAKYSTPIGTIWKFTLGLSLMGLVLGAIMAGLGYYRESIYFYDSVEEMERNSVQVPVEIRRHQPPRRAVGWTYLAIRTDGKYGTYDPHGLSIAPGLEGRIYARFDRLTDKPLVACISKRSTWHQGGRMVSAYNENGAQVLRAQTSNRLREYLVVPGILTLTPILCFLLYLPHWLKERRESMVLCKE